MTEKKSINCWIISSGLIGSENQCIGLAEELNFNYEIKKINPGKILSLTAPYGKPRKVSNFIEPWPKFIIGAGRKTIPYMKYLKSKLRDDIFTIFLQNPKIKTSNFDFVWAPLHDEIKGANTFSTLLSPGRISHDLITRELTRWNDNFSFLPKPFLTILIGGKTKAFSFKKEECLYILKTISKSIEDGWTPLISTSRRTPQFLKKEIKDIVKNIPHYYYDNIGDNPYYAFLGASNVALVTPDSVNMISETITANLSTYIFDLKCRSKRINKFLRKLEEENFVKKINGKINEFHFKENNATKEIADHLVKLI
tara:strand:- start:4848 stop:5780 length:933 start_codon:yes stop_codon:yes gene_type:complete